MHICGLAGDCLTALAYKADMDTHHPVYTPPPRARFAADPTLSRGRLFPEAESATRSVTTTALCTPVPFAV